MVCVYWDMLISVLAQSDTPASGCALLTPLSLGRGGYTPSPDHFPWGGAAIHLPQTTFPGEGRLYYTPSPDHFPWGGAAIHLPQTTFPGEGRLYTFPRPLSLGRGGYTPSPDHFPWGGARLYTFPRPLSLGRGAAIHLPQTTFPGEGRGYTPSPDPHDFQNNRTTSYLTSACTHMFWWASFRSYVYGVEAMCALAMCCLSTR